MAEYQELVRLRCIPKVYNTVWDKKVHMVRYRRGEEERSYQNELDVICSVSDLVGPKNSANKEYLLKFVNEVLGRIICSDRVRHRPSDAPQKTIGIEMFKDAPYLDNNDCLRDGMTEVHTEWVQQSRLHEINSDLAKMGLRPMTDVKGVRVNPISKEICYAFDFGRVNEQVRHR